MLDVTFNLNRSTYQPFTKSNTSLQYVHHESNHPPITTKNIPAGINRRLSSLSSDKASFDQAAPPYQKALDESGYHYTLQYEPAKASKRKNRQRNNILWYNPPFSKNTIPNSASISGPSKTTTSNTLFPGAFSHHTRRTTAQAKDVTSASKKNC